MKIMIAMLLAIIGFVACTSAPQVYLPDNPYETPSATVSTLEQLNIWEHSNIAYKFRANNPRTSQTVYLTMASREGNCTEQAALFIYLARKLNLDTTCQFAILLNPGRPIGHCIVYSSKDNRYYDPTGGISYAQVPSNYKLCGYVSYESVNSIIAY